MTGTQISNMDPSPTIPDGAVVPFIVPPATPGFDPSLNYIYDLGADLLTRVSYPALALATGASLVGDGDTTLSVSAPDTLAKFGALTDGSDATGGIDAALAATRQVEGLTGNYQVQGITLNDAGQVILARGATNFIRNANGAILDTSASDITINGIAFYGNDPTYTGDILNFTGQRGKLLFSASRDAGSDKGVKITGSAWLILGVNDVYDGAVEFTTDGVGGVSQYHNVIAARISGAFSAVDTSFVVTLGCLFSGSVTIDKGIETAGGHGARLGFSRITGATTITQSNTCIGSGMSSSNNVTIGDGVDNFTGITVDPSFVQQSGASFTVNTGVKGTFHVGNLVADGVTVSIPASVRQTSNVYHGEIDYTPTISGGGGSFVLGDGALSGKYSQQGNVITGRTVLSIGSTTTLPTSGIFTTVPVNTGGRPILCTIDIFVSGVGSYTAVGKIFSDGLRILGWLPQPAAIDSLFTNTVPAALGADDVVTWNFTYALGGT